MSVTKKVYAIFGVIILLVSSFGAGFLLNRPGSGVVMGCFDLEKPPVTGGIFSRDFRPLVPPACQKINTQDTPYFTIFAGDEKIVVTDEYLRGSWYNYESQKKFKNGQDLYARAVNCRLENSAATVKKDFPEIWQIILRLKRKMEVRAFDGDICFNPNPVSGAPRFSVVRSHVGRDLDEEKLCFDILSALVSGLHANITAKITQVYPKTEKETLAKIGLRGAYTTYFDDYPSREHNIALALECFNGMVIQNGETVSFNKIVGPRSSARGFQEAKIIIGGEFVPGVGGGVCQASTTLFNAVLLAGLRIDKSYNHSLVISYVPIGRDAMVSSASDLRFTNNTGGTIFIETGTVNALPDRDGRAYVKIYGNKTKIKYKPRVVVTESELGEDEIDPARQALTYIEAWSGEKLVHSKLIRKSKYKSRKFGGDD